MARENHMEGVGIVEFDEEDVVRSAQAKMWTKAFRDREILQNKRIRAKEQDDFHNTRFLQG
jgi:phosphate starvation-inducible protein PhoH